MQNGTEDKVNLVQIIFSSTLEEKLVENPNKSEYEAEEVWLIKKLIITQIQTVENNSSDLNCFYDHQSDFMSFGHCITESYQGQYPAPWICMRTKTKL